MHTEDRIEAFEKLGCYLSAIDDNEKNRLVEKVGNENPWFIAKSVELALKGIIHYLKGDYLRQWVSGYKLSPYKTKTVAVVMAGNIPLAGFHDFLSVLISGHSILAKLSSKDTILLSYLAEKLVQIEPRFAEKIRFASQLKNFDAVIATGSDNSSRYFHYYFGKYPNIIRKNRASCAILNGKESDDELRLLGADVFNYFGLGCRSVSKIFVPAYFDLSVFHEKWNSYKRTLDHHKYHNNYDYQKSILLVNQTPFVDLGFVLLQESERLVSPISVIYFEKYNDEGSLALRLVEDKEKIQCIAGHSTLASVPFGQTQLPMLWDYADQVNTLEFLTSLT